MNYCDECKMDIKDDTLLCPLCGNKVREIEEGQENYYPKFEGASSRIETLRKILIFFSIVIGALSLLINYYFESDLLWSLIPIIVIIYFWLALNNVIRKNTNPAFKILFQVIVGSIFIVAIDFAKGMEGWSFNFVVPVILCIGIASVMLLILFNRTNWARYVVYQSILGLFGFIPLILYFTGFSQSFIMSIIPSVFSFVCLVATFVFGDKTIKNEFKRRLHF